jgi:hypothetical protein
MIMERELDQEWKQTGSIIHNHKKQLVKIYWINRKIPERRNNLNDLSLGTGVEQEQD